MWRIFLLFYIMSQWFYIPTAAQSVSGSKAPSYNSVYQSNGSPQSTAWIGSAITAGASFIGGLFGNNSESKNIDKQIAAQKEENQKNREYNLMLAQQQNAWSQEQWERENEYNTPANQMARMKAAGLNPDLMAASGAQNLSASSPQMTAGAASQPADMSALGQKPTLGQAIQSALRDSMIGAQIDNIKANTKKTLADAEGTEIDNATRALANQLDIDAKTLSNNLSAQQAAFAEKEFEKLKIEIQAAKYQNKLLSYEVVNKKIESMFKEREIQAIVKDLENKAKLSENDAKFALESYVYRLTGVEMDAKAKEYESQFHYNANKDGSAAGVILSHIAPVISWIRKFLLGM